MDVKKIIFAFIVCFVLGAVVGSVGFWLMFNAGGDQDNLDRIEDLKKESIAAHSRELKYQEIIREVNRVSREDKKRLESSIERLESSLEESENDNKNLKKIYDSSGTIGELATETTQRLERIENILLEAGRRKQSP